MNRRKHQHPGLAAVDAIATSIDPAPRLPNRERDGADHLGPDAVAARRRPTGAA